MITSKSKLLLRMLNSLVHGPEAVPFSANFAMLQRQRKPPGWAASGSRLSMRDRRPLMNINGTKSRSRNWQSHGGFLPPRRCGARPQTPDGHAVDVQLEVMGKRTTLLPRPVATGSADPKLPAIQVRIRRWLIRDCSKRFARRRFLRQPRRWPRPTCQQAKPGLVARRTLQPPMKPCPVARWHPLTRWGHRTGQWAAWIIQRIARRWDIGPAQCMARPPNPKR
jgi:hypothetical protein